MLDRAKRAFEKSGVLWNKLTGGLGNKEVENDYYHDAQKRVLSRELHKRISDFRYDVPGRDSNDPGMADALHVDGHENEKNHRALHELYWRKKGASNPEHGVK